MNVRFVNFRLTPAGTFFVLSRERGYVKTRFNGTSGHFLLP